MNDASLALARLSERCPGLLAGISRACLGSSITDESTILAANLGFERADVLAAVSALGAAGALRAARPSVAEGHVAYRASESLPNTVRDALTLASLLPSLREQFDRERHATLIVSWPAVLGDLRLRRWRSSRIALVEMVDAARESVVFVFPFVDATGVQEIAPAAERALARGVQVVLLTRYLADPQAPNARFAARLQSAPGGASGFRAINISGASEDRRELLHAKVLLVDDGVRGYVGSANLTGSAFGESIEIGVAVEGAAAEAVAELVAELLTWGKAA
mgnify:CR=1 FL=1